MGLEHLNVVKNFNFVTSTFGPWERALYNAIII